MSMPDVVIVPRFVGYWTIRDPAREVGCAGSAGSTT
jgi:hypothetical protein